MLVVVVILVFVVNRENVMFVKRGGQNVTRSSLQV